MSDMKAQIALDFLKSFYLSDLSDEMKNEAKWVLLEYFKHPEPSEESK